MLASFSTNSDWPKRGRGRPLGPALVATNHQLHLHDLAMMRAVIQGVSLSKAAMQYLPEIHSDQRVTISRLKRLTSQAKSILEGLGEVHMAQALEASLMRHTGQLEAETQMPTLAEFCESLDDPDAWSESELIELYEEQFGSFQTKSSANRSMDAALQGLSRIQSTGVRTPVTHDPLNLWLSQSLHQRLRAQEIRTIHELVSFINNNGKHWYRRIPGVGKERADRLANWLIAHHTQIAPAKLIDWDRSALQPQTMSGLLIEQPGNLRALGPNAIGASSDMQALNAWLATLEFRSTHTRRAYAQDVGRLLAWAQLERGKSLSNLTVEDAAAHAKFLQNPPSHWVCVNVHARRSVCASTISMRGPLAPSSAKRALAAVSHFYGFLVETNYLSANPFAHIRLPKDRGVQMDVNRCFGQAHINALHDALSSMCDGPKKRRLLAVLLLLEGAGLRIGEIPVSWSEVVQQLDPETSKHETCLRVVGKGGRQRLIPLRPEILDALIAHQADQVRINDDKTSPLIGRIDEPITERSDNLDALSTSRIRVVLEKFFVEAASRASCPQIKLDLERATPHYLRHTFAHKVLKATDNNLSVTQQLLGHQSISTTGIYVKAGMAQRLSAISAVSLSFGKSFDSEAKV